MNVIYKVFNKIVRQTNWYNNIFWNGATKFWNVTQFNLDVVNLGSGAGLNAFCYEELPVKANNWALGPQSLVHDFNILKNHFSFIRDNGLVLITICPFSCLFSQYDKKHNLKYYTFLHPATIIGFEDEERTRALKIKTNPFKEMPLYCIKQTTKELLKYLCFWKHRSTNDLNSSAKQIMDGWKKQFGISDLSAPISEQHIAELQSRRKTLDEMITFCKERNLNPVIVIPPMYHSLHCMLPPEFKMNYLDRFLFSIDAPIYDYMCKKDFDDASLFTTALFLNKKGAKRFTMQLLMDLGLKK